MRVIKKNNIVLLVLAISICTNLLLAFLYLKQKSESAEELFITKVGCWNVSCMQAIKLIKLSHFGDKQNSDKFAKRLLGYIISGSEELKEEEIRTFGTYPDLAGTRLEGNYLEAKELLENILGEADSKE